MSKALEIFLVLVYGGAWVLSLENRYLSILVLASIGVLICLPKLIYETFVAAIMSVLIASILLIIPCLTPCAIFLPFIFLCLKIYEVYQNLLLIITGFFLYGILLFAPLYIKTKLLILIGINTSDEIISLLIFAVGGGVMMGICYLLKKRGYTVNNIAIHTIGLPGFFVLLLAFFLRLGHGNDGDSIET